MLRAISAIVFLELAYTVLMLAAGYPAAELQRRCDLHRAADRVRRGWAFVPDRNRR